MKRMNYFFYTMLFFTVIFSLVMFIFYIYIYSVHLPSWEFYILNSLMTIIFINAIFIMIIFLLRTPLSFQFENEIIYINYFYKRKAISINMIKRILFLKLESYYNKYLLIIITDKDIIIVTLMPPKIYNYIRSFYNDLIFIPIKISDLKNFNIDPGIGYILLKQINKDLIRNYNRKL